MIKQFIPLVGYFKYFFKRCFLKLARPDLNLGEDVAFKDVTFGKRVTIGDNSVVVNCVIGDYTYFSVNNLVKRTNIGKFCSIGPNVTIAPGIHPSDTFVSTSPVFYSPFNMLKFSLTDSKTYIDELPVSIGNDVWIGANVIVADGVRIGNGAIIAANSFVKDDVSDYSIVGGSPAKFIKLRFKEELIETLMKSEWWNWDVEYLKKNLHLFQNVELFNTEFK